MVNKCFKSVIDEQVRRVQLSGTKGGGEKWVVEVEGEEHHLLQLLVGHLVDA